MEPAAAVAPPLRQAAAVPPPPRLGEMLSYKENRGGPGGHVLFDMVFSPDGSTGRWQEQHQPYHPTRMDWYQLGGESS